MNPYETLGKQVTHGLSISARSVDFGISNIANSNNLTEQLKPSQLLYQEGLHLRLLLLYFELYKKNKTGLNDWFRFQKAKRQVKRVYRQAGETTKLSLPKLYQAETSFLGDYLTHLSTEEIESKINVTVSILTQSAETAITAEESFQLASRGEEPLTLTVEDESLHDTDGIARDDEPANEISIEPAAEAIEQAKLEEPAEDARPVASKSKSGRLSIPEWDSIVKETGAQSTNLLDTNEEKDVQAASDVSDETVKSGSMDDESVAVDGHSNIDSPASEDGVAESEVPESEYVIAVDTPTTAHKTEVVETEEVETEEVETEEVETEEVETEEAETEEAETEEAETEEAETEEAETEEVETEEAETEEVETEEVETEEAETEEAETEEAETEEVETEEAETEEVETEEAETEEVETEEVEDEFLEGLVEPPEDGFLYEDQVVEPLGETIEWKDDIEDDAFASNGRQIIVEKLVVQQQITEQSTTQHQSGGAPYPAVAPAPQGQILPEGGYYAAPPVAMPPGMVQQPYAPQYPQRPALPVFHPSTTAEPVREESVTERPAAKSFEDVIEVAPTPELAEEPNAPANSAETSAPAAPVAPAERTQMHADMEVLADSVNITNKGGTTGSPLANFDPARYLNLGQTYEEEVVLSDNSYELEDEEADNSSSNSDDAYTLDEGNSYLAQDPLPTESGLDATAKANLMLKELRQLKGGLF